MKSTCGYVSLKSGEQVHYRRLGEGPPLIILHPSPQSSAAMTASMTAFSALCTCIALDTPGYGLSDPMPIVETTLGDNAETLVQAISALGITKFFVYGSATGSQLAIEIAKRYPDRATFVLLDANGHISEEKCEEMVASGYFADVTPRRDGGHLLTYWDMCRQLFHTFPWNSDRPEDQLRLDMPPPNVVHDTFLRYLQAGENYTKAYKAAFYSERREHLDGMHVPAVMTRWASSPVLSLADALIEPGLPKNLRLLHADHGLEARFAVQIEALREQIAQQGLPKITNLKNGCSSDSSRTMKHVYLDSEAGQLHASIFGEEDGKPLVLLHAAAQSGAQLQLVAQELAKDRKVIVIDLPGHGGSFDLPIDQELSLEAFSTPLISALRKAGLDEIDIQGSGLGGAVGAVIAKAITTGSLTIVDPIAYTAEEQSAAGYHLPDLSPRGDGAHLVMAWAVVRNNASYWPLWDHRASALRKRQANLTPAVLHDNVADMLRLGSRWRDIARLEICIDWNEIVHDTIEVVATLNHPCPERLSTVSSPGPLS